MITFTWAGAALVSGSPGTTGSVGTKVPATATPGSYPVGASCGDETAKTTFRVTGTTTTSPPPPTTTVPPPTTTRTTPPTTRPITTTPPATTTAPATTTTTPATSSTPPAVPPPTSTPTTRPTSGGLLLDHNTVQPGGPLSASGAGCRPGHLVTLSSNGARVGHAVADKAGKFTAPVEFTTIDPGTHVITADCGVLLTGAVTQVITSSSDGNTGALIILVFFVLAGTVLVRFV